jgi:hypothetical protein
VRFSAHGSDGAVSVLLSTQVSYVLESARTDRLRAPMPSQLATQHHGHRHRR